MFNDLRFQSGTKCTLFIHHTLKLGSVVVLSNKPGRYVVNHKMSNF